MGWLNEDGVLYLWAKIKTMFATKDALQEVRDSMSDLGYGDMLKSTYDTNGDGIVDNAEKVNGHTVESDVPTGAFENVVRGTVQGDGGSRRLVLDGSTTDNQIPILSSTEKIRAVHLPDATTTTNGAVKIASSIANGGEGVPSSDMVFDHVKGQIDALENTYAKKTDITGVYKYKGSVTDESKLPTSGQMLGDVYDIQSASTYGAPGMNVAWNGTGWDTLGEVFTIQAITNTKIDEICV